MATPDAMAETLADELDRLASTNSVLARDLMALAQELIKSTERLDELEHDARALFEACLPPPPPLDPACGLPWPSGIGQNADSIAAFETWRGRPLGVYVGWTNLQATQTWDDLRGGPAGQLDVRNKLFGGGANYNLHKALKVLPKETPVVWVFPLVPQAERNSFEQGTWTQPGVWAKLVDTARERALITTVFEELGFRMAGYFAAMGKPYRRVTLDIGWECTGDWYAWSVGPDVVGFREYWRRAVDALRQGFVRADPAAVAIRIQWRVAGAKLADNRWHVQDVYPGDAWVDIIGRSLHEKRGDWGSPQGWQAELDGEGGRHDGMQTVLDFARSRGKKLGLNEWAVVRLPLPDGSKDFPPSRNPVAAVANVAGFLRANAADIAHEAYLLNAQTNPLGLETQWAGSAAYRQHFGTLPPPT